MLVIVIGSFAWLLGSRFLWFAGSREPDTSTIKGFVRDVLVGHVAFGVVIKIKHLFDNRLK